MHTLIPTVSIVINFSSIWEKEMRETSSGSCSWAFVIYLDIFIPGFNILQLSYRPQWASTNHESHWHRQLHLSLPEIGELHFHLLATENSVHLFCLVQVMEMITPLSERAFSRRHFETAVRGFGLLFWEPDPEATGLNSFSVAAASGSGSKGLFSTLLKLRHTVTAEPKRTEFMLLALNIECNIN